MNYRYKKIATQTVQPGIKERLLVSGFEKQKTISHDDISGALAPIPEYHLNGLQVIKFDPERKIPRLQSYSNLSVNQRALGEYLNTYKSIVIYDFKTLDEFKHLFYHELGHYVFYRVISSFDKKNWVTNLYRNLPKVSSYAEKNASEDFAESYAYYLMNPKKLQLIPSKFNFIQQKLF